MFQIDYVFSSYISNIELWKPKKDEDVFYGLEVELRWKDENYTTIFQVIVATPDSLLKRKERFTNALNLRNYILVSNYSWDKIYDCIKKIIEKSNVTNDEEKSTNNLLKYFFWEYEDLNK